MKIKRFKESLEKYPIISVEFREYKRIDKITVLKYSDENLYKIDDEIAIDYGVSVEILVSNNPKEYQTKELFTNDYETANELYNYFLNKCLVVK